jgi:hypothetical protein
MLEAIFSMFLAALILNYLIHLDAQMGIFFAPSTASIVFCKK